MADMNQIREKANERSPQVRKVSLIAYLEHAETNIQQARQYIRNALQMCESEDQKVVLKRIEKLVDSAFDYTRSDTYGKAKS